MARPHRPDVLLVRSAALRQDTVSRLNEILGGNGANGPVGEPEENPPEFAALPVSGGDPAELAARIQAARAAGGDLPEVHLDVQHTVGTVDVHPEVVQLSAAGKKAGHGLLGWTPVDRRQMAARPPWSAAAHHPVVALLDTPVRGHEWLPSEGFLEHAQWSPARTVEDDSGCLIGTHWGHGTFLAGILRLQAPEARVLSVPVMDQFGKVNEENAIKALKWLGDQREDGKPIDVVCMAFGRTRDPDEDVADPNGSLGRLRAAVRRLGDLGVTVVASAGNDGDREPTYPAAFAADPGSSLISVGAGASAQHRAPYSNYGGWVRQWWPGTDVVGPMPVTVGQTGDGNGYASWSGNSFAAVRAAAAQTVLTLV